MNKVKMLKSIRGSEDGLKVNMYYAGREYEVGDDLLRLFIMDGVVELVEEKAVEVEENKAIEKAPENKAIKRGRKKNKS